MKLLNILILTNVLTAQDVQTQCNDVYLETSEQVKNVKADDKKVVSILKSQIEIKEECICEIVKATIVASKADKILIQSIVEAAIVSSPNSIDDIVDCSLSVAPDASNEIMSVANKFNGGSSETFAAGNPLDYLGAGTAFLGQYLDPTIDVNPGVDGSGQGLTMTGVVGIPLMPIFMTMDPTPSAP